MTDTSKREELIEKARLAYVDAWESERRRIGRGIAESGTKSRAGIRAAFAVFEQAHAKELDTSTEPVKNEGDSLHVEKAHTPSDDEREAIINALLDELGWEWDEVPEEHIPSSREILGDMADRVLAVTADFRRPVQGEPTDAERDAEAKRIWPVDREYSPQQTRAVFSVKELDAYCVSAFTRGAKWAAGFRRTAVQEPSAEEVDESAPRYQPCHFDTSGMYVRTWCHTHGYDHLTPDGDVYVQGFDLGDGKTYTGPVSQEDLFGVEPQGEPKHDASCGERCNHCQECGTGITYGSRCPDHYLNQSQGEPTDAPTVQLAARRGGKVQAMIDSMLAQANERGIRVEVVYPQGEPERGAVERAVDAFVSAHDEIGESLHDSMRAALTAAYETKGEQ